MADRRSSSGHSLISLFSHASSGQARLERLLAAVASWVAASAVGAQTPSSAITVPRATAIEFTATTQTTAAANRPRAQHVPSTAHRWQLRIDSIVGGALFARMPGDGGIRYRVDGALRLPVQQGRAGVPVFASRPSRLRNAQTMDRGVTVLPLVVADRAAQHEAMLTTLMFAAAFDGLPTGDGVAHFADSADRLALRVDATRRYRSLHDSVVNGRATRVVRDSTNISYTIRRLLPSSYTTVVATSADEMRGTIVGTRLVDLGTRRTIAMQDTVRLEGRRRSADGYGGLADLPHYEFSTRSLAVRDSLSPPLVHEPFDMVRSSVQPSLPSPSLVDSLIARLRFEPRVSMRDSLRAIVQYANGVAVQERLVAASLAVGDTAAAVRLLTSGPYGAPHAAITTALYQWMRRLLVDASASARVGVNRELMAVMLIDHLLHAPPVLASNERDSAICAAAACRAMARDATMQTPSLALRAVALVAAMVTEPRVWTDSVIANARTNPLLGNRALWFARGASSYALASAKAPIPEAEASSEAWRYWLMGQDSGYVRARATMARTPVSFANAMTLPVVVDNLAATALRFASRRTGVSYASAFRARRAATSDDSTRALFTALLLAIDDSALSEAELMAIVLGPPTPERRTVIQQRAGSGPFFGEGKKQSTLASDSIATRIGLAVIESLFGGTPLTFVADANTRHAFFNAPPAVDSIPRFVILDSLPLAVRERAAALGRTPMPIGWSLAPGSTGATTHVSGVRQSGPFYSIRVTYTTLHTRDADRSGGYANGFVLWFVESPQGWVVFSATAWIT